MHRYFSPINSDTDQILISQRTTNGFNKAAGQFSQTRDEFSKRKRWKLVAKRKKKTR
jgi:hypothetical protein